LMIEPLLVKEISEVLKKCLLAGFRSRGFVFFVETKELRKVGDLRWFKLKSRAKPDVKAIISGRQSETTLKSDGEGGRLAS